MEATKYGVPFSSSLIFAYPIFLPVEDDIFEVVKIEPSIKQKLMDYIRTNNIKPLNMYNRSEAIKIFQQFIKYYIDTISEYDFCEKGDETTYSIY